MHLRSTGVHNMVSIKHHDNRHRDMLWDDGKIQHKNGVYLKAGRLVLDSLRYVAFTAQPLLVWRKKSGAGFGLGKQGKVIEMALVIGHKHTV